MSVIGCEGDGPVSSVALHEDGGWHRRGRQEKLMKAVILGAAVGLVTVGLAVVPATGAGAVEESAKVLSGTWVGVGVGLGGSQGGSLKPQARFVLKDVHGADIRGTYQWRSCEPRPKKCKRNDLSGKGWSAKETVIFTIEEDMNVVGVEGDALWDGELASDGTLHLVLREMTNASPNISPLLIHFDLVKAQ